MSNFKEKRWFLILRTWIAILLGSYCMARSFTVFFVPNGIAPGGINGIATLIYVSAGLPVGLMSLVMNVPLFLLGWRQGGLRFILRTLAATVLVSVLIDYLPCGITLSGEENDLLLSAIFGGILLGLGVGLVFQGRATTGGTDLAASLIHKKFPAVRVAWVLFGIDLCVVVASAFVSGLRTCLYSFIALYISAKVTDMVQLGVNNSKACYIITDHADAIRDAIMTKMERGVTEIFARGGFTGKSKMMLLCVVSGHEVMRLKTIVNHRDPEAFLIVTDAMDVKGEGFNTSTNPMEENSSANVESEDKT